MRTLAHEPRQTLRMEIAQPVKDPDEPQQIKINLPRDLRMRLHVQKLLHGTTISSTIQVALEEYFVRLQDDKARQGAAASDPA